MKELCYVSDIDENLRQVHLLQTAEEMYQFLFKLSTKLYNTLWRSLSLIQPRTLSTHARNYFMDELPNDHYLKQQDILYKAAQIELHEKLELLLAKYNCKTNSHPGNL
jgi:hypothetical protein